MTKVEYEKCKKLMEDAINKTKQAEIEYNTAQGFLNCENRIAYEIETRKADQHYGYAEGINQVLTVIGFKHDRMKELSGLL